jgi:WD40 repeat protein
MKGHTGWILSACFSPNGRTLLTASDDHTARLWDVLSGRQLQVLSGHTAGLNAAAFDSKGQRILTASEDETARVWDLTGRQLKVWATHESSVRASGFEIDDRKIWTRTVDGVKRVWSIDDSELPIEQHISKFPRFDKVYVKDEKNAIEIWFGPPGAPGELDEDKKLIRKPLAKPHLAIIGSSGRDCLAITMGGSHVATADSKDIIWICETAHWNKVTGAGRISFDPRSQGISCLTLSSDGSILATGHVDGDVNLWDLTAQKLIERTTKHSARVAALAISHDRKLLASVSKDGTVHVTDLVSKKQLVAANERTGEVEAVAFSLDNRKIATGSRVRDWESKGINEFKRPGEVILWDVATGKELHSFRGFIGVTSVAFSPDGKTLAAGSDDCAVHLWSTSNYESINVLKGSGEMVRCIAFSPDSKLLGVGHYFSQGMMSIWDLSTGRELTRVHAHRSSVHLLAFKSDGETIVTGSDDGTIKIWKLNELKRQGQK